MIVQRKYAVLVVSIAVLIGLSNIRSAHAGGPASALVLYPNATTVRSGSLNGTQQLTYHVYAKYPATEVISGISQKLEDGGWKPLTYDFLNPDLDAPMRMWGELKTIRNPSACDHAWSGYWKDKSANIVMYSYVYHDPDCRASDLTDLEVRAYYLPATLAKQLQHGSEQLHSLRTN
jgi:hypothetical protein